MLKRVYQGSTDCDLFEDFIAQLLHYCGRYPEPKPVIAMDNLFKLVRQQLLVNPSLIQPAMWSLLAKFSSTRILLVDSSPKASFGGSLKPLSLCHAFFLLALRCCSITSNFL